MKSLAHIPKKPTPEAAPAMTISTSPDEEPKPQYPKLTLNGEQAEKAGLNKCKIGQEYTVELHIKATKLGGTDYSIGQEDSKDKPMAEFDVLAADEPLDMENETDEEEAAEDEPPSKRPKSRVQSPRDMKGADDAYED